MQDWSKPLTPQNLCMGTTPFSQGVFNCSVDFIQVLTPPSRILTFFFCVNFSPLLITSITC